MDQRLFFKLIQFPISHCLKNTLVSLFSHSNLLQFTLPQKHTIFAFFHTIGFSEMRIVCLFFTQIFFFIFDGFFSNRGRKLEYLQSLLCISWSIFASKSNFQAKKHFQNAFVIGSFLVFLRIAARNR